MVNLTNYKLDTIKVEYNNIFLLSDIHFGVRANSLEWLSNQKEFFNEFYIPYLRKNCKEGDILFILGDWFDNRQLLDIYVMNTSVDIVLTLASILPVHFITGNHDIYKKYDTDVNSLVAFRYIPNVFVYEKPVIMTNNLNKILILPWIGNSEVEENYVRSNKFDYIFTHSDISGFQYDNGREIKKSGTDFLKFRSIKKLFSGHIHKRQEVGNFVYIGSPYHTKRSDIGNSKLVYKFNPQNNSYETTLNDYSPAFQRILLEGILELNLYETKQILQNNYTDIIVPDRYVHQFNLSRFLDIIKDCNYKKIETRAENKKSDVELFNFGDASDIRDILALLEINIEDLGHNMEVLIKLKLLNRDYYEKASKETIF